MKYSEIDWVHNNSNIDFPTNFGFTEYRGLCAVNNQVGLPLEAVSVVYERGVDIPIENKAGQTMGFLCLCKDIELDLSSITEPMYIAYIDEIEKEFYGQPYRFKYDYVILNINFYDDYMNDYRDTAPLWGGFLHPSSAFSYQPQRSSLNKILAISQLTLPTMYHRENCLRSIIQPYAFERFLKLYHLLELLFDYDVVQRINSLGSNFKDIGKLLQSYSRDEYERLFAVIERRINNVIKIENRLDQVRKKADYIQRAKVIFSDYSKEHDPIKKRHKETEFDIQILNGSGFSESNFQASGLISSKPAFSNIEYRKLIIEIATYWIYRIRCSIAHNRIGEYVMDINDEEFIVEVIEPLLREILIQIFSPS